MVDRTSSGRSLYGFRISFSYRKALAFLSVRLHLIDVSPPSRGMLRHHIDAVSFLARDHNKNRGEIKAAI